ncbi:hypothetical protein [Leptospira broomii]|uniref:hypothetical protein n=1 Tax=Leptospira broomii TaxID=301541 RepID=UPI0018DDFBF6|nr:hypothetical protein [Leptospira broomii]
MTESRWMSEASCSTSIQAKINSDFPTSQYLWNFAAAPTAAAPTLLTITCSYGTSRNTAVDQCATLSNAY